MLQSIQKKSISPEKMKKSQKQGCLLKKNCLFKKKLQGIPEKSKIDCIYNRYFNIYNILYVDLNAMQSLTPSPPKFLQEIFSFHTISKVTKNRDRTILSLKLCPRLSKTISNKTSLIHSGQSQKKCPITQFNIADQKNSFRINVQKIHNMLHQQQQSLRQKNQGQSHDVVIYQTQAEISQKIEEITLNIQSKSYIIFQNLFKPTCKRIKNIHFSNQFLELIGSFNENLVFDLLQKRSLPFQIFKKLDNKLFVENCLENFLKVLESVFHKKNPQTQSKQESFSMKGVIEGKEQKQKVVTLKWTCSHPSIIVMEIFEQVEQKNNNKEENNGHQKIQKQLQNIQIL